MFFNGTKNFIFGFSIGFGVGFLSRDLAPFVKKAARPGLKEAIKISIRGFERMKEGFFHFGEVMEDLTEEVKVEMKKESKPKKRAKKPKPASPVRPIEPVPPVVSPLRRSA